MRIVIYQDYLRVGGTESQSIYLAEQFKNKGDDVWLVTNRPGGSLWDRVLSAKIDHLSLQSVDRKLNYWAPKLLPCMRKLNPEVILLMGRNANAKGKQLKTNLLQSTVIGSFRTGRKVPWRYLRSLACLSKIFCNSDFARRRLIGMGISEERLEVHPNACRIADKIEAVSGTNQRSTNEGLNLVYLASFIPGKNHLRLLELFQKLQSGISGVQLHLAGEGPLMESCKRKAEAMDILSDVHFHGYRDDIASFLQTMDIAVSPSIEESMPNALVEAQYSGLPVVAYDVAGVGECFSPGQSGILVGMGDEQRFLEAVSRLIRNAEERKKMSQAAVSFAREHFDPKVRFDAFYKSVLECAQARS